MSGGHSHELAAFRRELDHSTRLAAEAAFVVCSDLRGLLTGIAALGVMVSADPGSVPAATVVALAQRLRDVRRRLAALEGLDRAGLAGVMVATADLEQAVDRVAEARSAQYLTPWPALTDCYAAIALLRRGLWAFELRPEGAPLSAGGRSRYDEGFNASRAAG